MDSSASGYLLNHPALHSEYCIAKEDSNLIDLGLSLKTLQPEAYYPSPHENYEVLLDWQEMQPHLKTGNSFHRGEEFKGTRSKQHWTYVKVNMDGLLVGRKLCIIDHVDYPSLACRLEEMFGKQSLYGLRLFEDESPFSLFYKDREDQWRTVGDVPWKEFVDRVTRLRIARKDGTNGVASSLALQNTM